VNIPRRLSRRCEVSCFHTVVAIVLRPFPPFLFFFLYFIWCYLLLLLLHLDLWRVDVLIVGFVVAISTPIIIQLKMEIPGKWSDGRWLRR
jgi:hypothetical protein